MASDRLIYLPLGGAGEIGMNCYVYGYGPPDHERLIVVDLGVTFPDMETTPGVDLILPDISWLEARADRIEGLFITHAHEDHVGALGHLWNKLKAPVYCRAFTSVHAKRKLEEHGGDPEAVNIASAFPSMIPAGPFQVSFLPVSHSIPESSGLVIDTPKGRLLHTGDFKLDPTPVLGDPFDSDLWAEVAGDGLHALICDSTNVFSPQPGRSEASVGPEIEKLVAQANGMVVATTFASNIARLKTLAEAGERAGRSICLLGRAMRRMIEAGVSSGVLTDFPKTIPPEDAREIPRENLLLIVTGSQGERRAASAQLSRGKYLGLTMQEGDLFLFSSKTIPGNEAGVIRIMNAYSEMGVDVVDDSSGLYHVSGHANRPDLEAVHKLTNPSMVIPMHGEHRHLREHSKLAKVPSIVAVNGTMLDLSGTAPDVAEYIETGRVYYDGKAYVGALDGVIRDRIRMALNGHIAITLILDEDNETIGEPWCEIFGLPDIGSSNTALVDVIEEDLSQFLGRSSRSTRADDGKLEDELRRIARRSCEDEIGKKPETTIIVSRVA